MSSISLYSHTIISLFIFLLMDIWVVFSLGLVLSYERLNFFCGPEILFLLVKGVEFWVIGLL